MNNIGGKFESKKSFSQNKSSPLWIFLGPELGERERAVDGLRARMQKSAGAVDCYSLYVSDVKIADVVALLQNGSLFASARFAALRGAESIKKKEDVDLLREWAANSAGNENAVLALISDETSIDKRLEALAPKEQKKIFWELFDDKKEQWIASCFRSYGKTIDRDVASVVLELSENDTQTLGRECMRIALFYGDFDHITSEQAEAVLAHNREESPFTLFDRMSYGDLEGALSILNKLLAARDCGSVQILAGLTYCFRRLADWIRLEREGVSSELELKKNGFTSRRARDQYKRASRLWSAKDCARILALLSDADMQSRGGAAAVNSVVLEAAIYSCVRKKGVPLERPFYL